jgi:hypothetical protein
MTGDIDERGFLPPWTRFTAGWPFSSFGASEKSVSWLLRTKPPTVRFEPNTDSTVVVMDTTFPAASTTTKWLVPADSWVASFPCGGTTMMFPGGGAGPAFSPMSWARRRKYAGSSSRSDGTAVNCGSST